MTLMMAICDI